ncbi:hypothetical protein RUM44_005046 [Polyplax serrata]|uniref:Coronin n=1 Tax=Polyplax serrata TaxID=468196 RepID=A0ABR1AWV7_POLSC
MAWRFKASKYKNAVPVVPKPESCVRDLTVGSYQTYGHNITATAAFMAFNTGQNGSNLAVLQIDDCGRKGKDMALLHAHTHTVTDMSFSPFHDGLLATGSQDLLVKIWHIPKNGLQISLTDPECILYSKTQRRVETVLFHPTADCLLSTSSFTVLNLWDITTQQAIYNNADDHTEVIQCLNWKSTGDLLATTCKDKQLRILDCRRDKSVIHELTSHQGIKDSRVVWLNDGNRLLTTGFNWARQREVCIRDIRKLNQTEKTLELDSSTGILLPLYDPDTNMLFLAGKGDTSIMYMEVTNRDPYLIEGLRHNGEQTKGACLVPKRALNVMQGEVNRILQLTSTMVIPIMYQVPRKTYRDFHADLYPDTAGCVSDLTPSDWMSGKNVVIPKISLDPAKKENENKVLHRGSLQELCAEINNRKTSRNQTKQPPMERETKPKPKQEPDLLKKIQEDPLREAMKNFNPIRNGTGSNQNGDTTGGDFNGEATETLKDLDNDANPPKPMPRSSRSNSVDIYEDRPIAKPRMHKNSLDPSQTFVLDAFRKDVEEEYSEKFQPAVIQSVNPLMPITGGYKPRLGPKPFTPPKLQSFSSFEKNPPSEPNVHENEYISQANVAAKKIADKPKLGYGEVEPAFGDVRNASDYEKILNYETGVNDFSNMTESDKVYEKNDFEKICNKTNELNIHYDKIENEIDKPLKKVHNVDEILENTKKKQEKPVSKDDDEGESEEFVVPRTPSMAERRKLFETGKILSEEKDIFDGIISSKSSESLKEDESTSQRSSIAERRRLYENRTVSVQEPLPMERTSPSALRRRGSLKTKSDDLKEEPNRRSTLGGPIKSTDKSADKKTQLPPSTPTPKRTSTVFGKHLKGTPMHKSTFIENIRNVSRQVSGECDGFHANCDRVAVPLSGPGGKIAVFEVSKTGRLPDLVTPTLVHGTTVMDFCWDNFNNRKLAVAGDDGLVRLWIIPEGGLEESTNEPNAILECHTDKIYCMKFHPLAKDVLATASYDLTIKIWDLEAMKEKLCLTGHTDQIFCLSWSPCGKFLATMCKDGFVRIFNPRQSSTPIKEGKGPVGTRGARLIWALDGAFIVVLGFDKVSERQILVYKSTDLSQPLTTVGIDVSPAILMPFYDEDSSTLFLTGRGDSTIYTFEVTEEQPYVCPLSHHRCSSLHQGLSFLSKKKCDVAAVEFARALRLSNNTIEPLSFTVPRIKSELFQDDLFPPTKVIWEPTMTSSEWFEGGNKQAKRVSLKPPNMESLSTLSTQTEKNTSKSTNSSTSIAPQSMYNKFHPEFQDHVKSAQEQIQKAVSSRMEINMSLEQDHMEGVDEHEWDE